MRIATDFPSINSAAPTTFGDLPNAEFKVGNGDVLALDLQNAGSAALTAFEVWGRRTPKSPYRKIPIPSFTSASYTVLEPADLNPATLASGSGTSFALNVSTYESVKLRATGANGNALQINAALYNDEV